MKKILIGLLVLVVVGLGVYSFSHKKSLGGTVETNPVWFYNGLSAGQTSTSGAAGSKFLVSTAGALTVNGVTNSGSETITGALTAGTITTTFATSSSSPAALGAAVAGHLVVAAGSTTFNASTTAVTANSDIQLQVEQVTPIAGTTCNTTIPTTTPVIGGITAGNGFTGKVLNGPVTNPLCLSFSITN